MKIIWYPPQFSSENVVGPFYITTRGKASGVVEIKCTYVEPRANFRRNGYNIARVEDVPADQYDTVAENVRLMAEMGLYEQAL